MLKLLLDEHVSPDVASGLRRRNRGMVIHAMAEWEGGSLLGQDDAACLHEASVQRLTFVTYDRRTIPPLLKAWAEEEQKHGGVIFIDEKAISQADIGGLVLALSKLAKDAGILDWTNRVAFLRRRFRFAGERIENDLLGFVKPRPENLQRFKNGGSRGLW